MCQGNYAVVRATNKVGMERSGFSEFEINNINRAMRILLKGTTTIDEALTRISAECEPTDTLKYFVDFIKSSKRGIAK
jgi:UDP-N-acetylglucosamine acyltransferase